MSYYVIKNEKHQKEASVKRFDGAFINLKNL